MGLKSVTIWGSCVSRDIFNQRQDRYSVYLNIQRNSVKTIYGNALDLDERMYDCAGNGWNARMLKYNAEKSVPSILSQKPTDYILIDLVDDRFNLASFLYKGKQIYIPYYLGFEKLVDFLKTQENEFPFENLVSLSLDKLSESFLDEGIARAAELLKKIYRQDQIIINEFYLLSRYVDAELNLCEYPNQAGIGKMNAHLHVMYEKLEKALPEARIIRMPEHTLGEPNHLWGLASTHAEKSYYAYVLDCMDVLCGFSMFNTTDKMCAVQSRENLLRLRMLEKVQN